MKRLCIILLILNIVSVVIFASGTSESTWPSKPVQIIVPAGAGGGTDATARILAKYLKAKLGTNFNVVNQGQGGGIVGFESIKNAKPDGYTIGLIYNFAHYKALGQADLNVDDFTILPQINFDPAGFQVNANSEWVDLKQALDAVKSEPENYAIGCGGGCGGSWPMAIAILMDKYGIETSRLKFIPGQGAAAAMQELAAGGFDIVPSSLPEARAMLEAGQARSLVIMSKERHPKFPDVPTTKESIGFDVEAGAFRGVVGPKGLPQEVVETLDRVISEIYNDSSWQEEMKSQGLGIYFLDSNDFKNFLYDQEKQVGKLINSLGL